LNKTVHIVCLDAPCPADYGGAIDMFCKIKTLAQSGVSVLLHYFHYKPERHADGVLKDCAQVFSYKRKRFLSSLPFSKPHIVASRINRELIVRLNADDHPILLEGVHCAGIIPYLKDKERTIVVRLQNDEAVYYRRLAETENNFFKSSYYRWESFLLKKYQHSLPKNIRYAAVSQRDIDLFRHQYGLRHIELIPSFTPWQEDRPLPGNGTYCLYHGNLTVAENKRAVYWLIRHVFSRLKVPLYIAGKNIPESLKRAAKHLTHISFFSNPDEPAMAKLIREAHIHVLPDFNNTGLKLKFLHALFVGRFCITNKPDVPADNTVIVAQTPDAYIQSIKILMRREFDADAAAERVHMLRFYSNERNAEKLNALLW
jgi:hypothetical protein